MRRWRMPGAAEHGLGGMPLARIMSVAGLIETIAYLDARRALARRTTVIRAPRLRILLAGGREPVPRSTFALVDGVAEQKRLEQLIEATKPTIPMECAASTFCSSRHSVTALIPRARVSADRGCHRAYSMRRRQKRRRFRRRCFIAFVLRGVAVRPGQPTPATHRFLREYGSQGDRPDPSPFVAARRTHPPTMRPARPWPTMHAPPISSLPIRLGARSQHRPTSPPDLPRVPHQTPADGKLELPPRPPGPWRCVISEAPWISPRRLRRRPAHRSTRMGAVRLHRGAEQDDGPHLWFVPVAGTALTRGGNGGTMLVPGAARAA